MSSPAEAQAPPAAGDAPPPTPVAVGDWPVEDDFLLRESVEAGAALGAIARGILPFSKPYTREDITRRWRALLYDPSVARPAARRMAQYILDAKPRVAPLPVGPDFRSAYESRRAAAASAAEGDSAAASAAPTDAETGADQVGTLGILSAPSPPTPPGFAEAEQAVLDMPPRPSSPQVDPASRRRARVALAGALRKIRRLEASAQACSARAATAKGALAMLQGSNAAFALTKRETVLGRSTEDQKVDVDLSEEGNASKVSRQQAFIKLRWNGEFCLRNVGRRPVWINNVAVESGRRCALAPHSLVEVGGMRLLFVPNPTLVRAQHPEPF